ncbi:branched-chain amino acid ABC transporter permease [Desulfospira joergensenii]|uniref:branched-chain amino acid ABC transporter permease n=1 Tax=Desulfospira joergensenii TaxID=53329 RepID=UPI0003B6E507|nr:branched-chain amino acid ABC transporter permease [Desulfospira joergensenii]
MINSKRPLYSLGIFITALALCAFCVDSFTNDYFIAIVCFAGINIVLAVSLNLTNGFTGLFSLGHPAFMAIGGYTTALLTFSPDKKPLFLPDLPLWMVPIHVPFFPALVAGGCLASLVALLIGSSVLRLKGHYLAVATMGFLIIVQVLLNNSESVTRGPLGLNGLEDFTNLYWVAAWVAFTIYFCWKIKFSSLGRAMLAMREDEMAANSLGVDLFAMRNFALVSGAFFAGIAGGLWAHLITAVTPGSFSLIMSFNLVVMVVVGGTGSITGSALAAVFFTLINEAFRPLEENFGIYGVGEIVTSLVLISILIFRPSGMFGSSEPGFILGRHKPQTGN